MKPPRGFALMPVLLAVIVILGISGGAYVYTHQQKTEKSLIDVELVPSTHTASTTVQAEISVPGMSKYTDNEFDFSFWYPNTWGVTTSDQRLPTYGGDTFKRTLVVSDGTRTILLAEYNSPSGLTYSFGKASGSIYFDTNSHQWMDDNHWSPTQGLGNYPPVPLDISVNTMGGLHIIASEIIPLSVRKFVVVDHGVVAVDMLPLAKTIVATDASVATSVSQAEQIKAIKAEQAAYAGQ
jgi:hypothetical protein